MTTDNKTDRLLRKLAEELSPAALQGVTELLLSENLCVDKEALGDFLNSFNSPIGKIGLPKYNPENSLLHRGGVDRLQSQYSRFIFQTDEGKELVQELKKDSRVSSLKGKMISSDPQGGISFSMPNFAMWYIWAQNEYGSELAKTMWEDYLNADHIPILQSLWVLGVKVEKPISLIKNVSLTPASCMPDSRNKEFFQKYFHDIGDVGASLYKGKPLAAISIQASMPKIWESSECDETSSNDDLFRDLSLLLNLIPEISCIPFFSTSYILPDVPPGLFLGSGGGSLPQHDVIGDGSHELTVEMLKGFEELFNSFSKLSSKEKPRFEHALSRLSLAKRRKLIEDKILDLAIALEMVLLDGQTEQLTFTFRLRGSWLIAEDAKERKEIHDMLKSLYGYRCQVAHTGVLEKNDQKKIKAVREAFPQYISVAERIISKLILKGQPVWSDLLLGSSI